ncbi:DUF411 domain-containing protein [Halocatena marina]|uniref:DUF411 domain-containing protein n=1 Tax=Halocatena marina TaxID=2934937 RepID=A0ABD5YV27_9EURY
MPRRRFCQLASISAIGALAGCASNSGSPSLTEAKPLLATSTLVKTPSCTCCQYYADALTQRDITLNIKSVRDLLQIKRQKGIPQKLHSCHTILTEQYVIEGHVPFEALNKLATEQPDIKGIALPGMPAGSVGMGGTKQEKFTVVSFTDSGKLTIFIRV